MNWGVGSGGGLKRLGSGVSGVVGVRRVNWDQGS